MDFFVELQRFYVVESNSEVQRALRKQVGLQWIVFVLQRRDDVRRDAGVLRQNSSCHGAARTATADTLHQGTRNQITP